MMRVLMSIKQEYADNIFAGEKTYEYRRALPKRNDVDTVVVYVSAPVCMVVGEFNINHICTGSSDLVWKLTGNNGGITKEVFDEYFWGDKDANAICIDGLIIYKNPKPLSDYGITRPPQNFMYLKEPTDA